MLKLLFVASLAIFISCADERVPLAAYAQSPAVSVANTSLNLSTEKQYRKAGSVMLFENSYDEKNNGVKVWGSPYQPKEVIYNLKYGQDVFVYGKASDYLLVAPKSDTTRLGYILSGWITYESDQRINNITPVDKKNIYKAAVSNKKKNVNVDNRSEPDKSLNSSAAKVLVPDISLEIKTDSIISQ